ncbi:C-glycoside deglycosidase beta subunit domain-containing protein [Klebsiella pneumoniae]|uniref:C-glycoside deglycosidase beta subunit domain-containing protein n=1 Tax=Klebsiella pneumoniae TaxID=573 RepID=UPI0021528979|nr:DUF6379 domain-containing protein [Klebsiella pneumoniae]
MKKEQKNYGEKATITVLKPGGLPAGWHRLKVAERLRISYLPFVPVTIFFFDVELWFLDSLC